MKETTAFREAERYWKQRTREPDYKKRALNIEDIIWDSENRGTWHGESTITGEPIAISCVRHPIEMGRSAGPSSDFFDRRSSPTECYCVLIPQWDGLVLLPNCITKKEQRILVKECLRHSRAPNVTSLDAHYDIPEQGVWNMYEAGDTAQEFVRKDHDIPSLVGTRTRVDYEPITPDNFRNAKDRGKCSSSELATMPVKTLHCSLHDMVYSKLRWTTIGLTYDWTSKVYDFDAPIVPLPPNIGDFCASIVRRIDWSVIFGSTNDTDWRAWGEDYKPEAGIINYYHLKDSLTGHVDQSEVSSRPLVSGSLGHSAIFLMGGPTRDTPPLSIRLNSGDAVIMAGPVRRRSFHGLPRVIFNSLPDHFMDCSEDDPEWHLFQNYLNEGHTRVNFNIRQVFENR